MEEHAADDIPEIISISISEEDGSIFVHLSDGSRIPIGMPFSAEFHEYLPSPSLEDAKIFGNLSSCYRGALGFLARREHSSQQLRLKLMKRKFGSSVISRTLKALEDEGSLSDHRFSLQWIASRLQTHPEGPELLIPGLRNRGVDSGTARSALEEYLEEFPDAMHRACLSFLLKLNRTGTPSDEIPARAEKRGFRKSLISDCADEFNRYTGNSYSV